MLATNSYFKKPNTFLLQPDSTCGVPLSNLDYEELIHFMEHKILFFCLKNDQVSNVPVRNVRRDSGLGIRTSPYLDVPFETPLLHLHPSHPKSPNSHSNLSNAFGSPFSLTLALITNK